MPTNFVNCDSPSYVGNRSNDTAIDEPILSDVEEHRVLVSVSPTKNIAPCTGSTDVVRDNEHATTTKPVPLALRRLKDYNKPGRLEC